MKSAKYLTAILAVLAVQPVAQAQFFFEDDEPPAPPWQSFKLNPKVRLGLDFRNASVDAVLQYVSKASGVTIVKDPALTGGITLQSPRPQTLSDTFAQLNAVLNLKNFELQKEGNFLIIRAKQQRQNNRPSFNFEQFAQSRGSSGILRVYPIKYANATQVARVINEVFINSGDTSTQTPTTPQAGQPTVPIGGGRGGRGPNAGSALTADAATPAPAANPTPAQPAGARPAAQQGGFGGRGNRGGQNFGGFGGGGFGGFGRRGGTTGNSVVRASADDFSNSVIVNAPSREQDQVAQLIEQIDKQTDQPQQSRVFALQFAAAADLAPIVQNVLVSNAPRGRGGIGTQNVPIEQRFQAAARFGSTQAAFGSVVADTRTNALIVTGTAENLALVENVVKELDKEVSYENSTFVLTLENARADDVADLVNQSFGGTNRGGTTRRATARTGTGQNRIQNRRNTGNTNTGAGRGPNSRQETPQENSVPVELADPNAASGELATNVSVEERGPNLQQFGFGGGRGNQTRNQAQPPTGLDAQGRVVNVRDLTGQVTAIPDINTNSVVIVTSPENRALLEQILRQLDRIPEQVMIETLIVEASLDATSRFGVEWTHNDQRLFGTSARGSGSAGFGLQGNTTQPQGLRYTLTGTEYSAFLQAVKTDSRFDVLSTPRIFTSNNSTAEINISQSLPYVVSQRTDVNGNFLFNYDFLDVGIILTVTPRITSNGYVTMDVVQTANEFVRYTEFNAPVVNQREAQTTVSVKDGETVILGGIIRNTVSSTVNKVPILGDIPLLGNLFKSNTTTSSKTELLVFLTPRVVRDESEARRLREETGKQINKGTLKRINNVLTNGQTPPAQPTNGETPKATPPLFEEPKDEPKPTPPKPKTP